MVRRVVFAVIAVFVAWSVLDFLIHGLMLQPIYEATAELWRPMNEMKMGLMYVVTAVGAACFVGIYASLIQPKSLAHGLQYGLLFGVGTGIPMGLGTYSVMPIPLSLAVAWLLGALVESLVGGLLTASIVKEPKAAS